MPYTEEAVNRALNQAADLIVDDEGLFPMETGDSIKARTLIDLLVGATMFLLRTPGMTLDDIMNANWQPDEDHETAAAMVRYWLS